VKEAAKNISATTCLVQEVMEKIFIFATTRWSEKQNK
jgi:hypothetical protein